MSPRLIIDHMRYPQLADNIWHAQMDGHPKVLTYNGPDIVVRKATRKAALHYFYDGQLYEIPRILSRDEYPFACTVEGGGSSWVGHIPAVEKFRPGRIDSSVLKTVGNRSNKGEHYENSRSRWRTIQAVLSHENELGTIPATGKGEPPLIVLDSSGPGRWYVDLLHGYVSRSVGLLVKTPSTRLTVSDQ